MIPYRKKERGKCKHLDRVYSKDEYNPSPNPMRNTYIYPFVERDPYWKSKSKEYHERVATPIVSRPTTSQLVQHHETVRFPPITFTPPKDTYCNNCLTNTIKENIDTIIDIQEEHYLNTLSSKDLSSLLTCHSVPVMSPIKQSKRPRSVSGRTL